MAMKDHAPTGFLALVEGQVARNTNQQSSIAETHHRLSSASPSKTRRPSERPSDEILFAMSLLRSPDDLARPVR